MEKAGKELGSRRAHGENSAFPGLPSRGSKSAILLSFTSLSTKATFSSSSAGFRQDRGRNKRV